MPRGWIAVLCLALLLWWPVGFATELSTTLPSLGMRGVRGAIELLFHAIVAALAVAAVRALSIGMPSAPMLAAAALVSSAAASIQSLYWSVLPHQTMPGDALPMAVLAAAHAAVWLVYLWRSRRVRELAG
ncbi:MAG TPA: hypothetical protein VH740_07180 [Vicinamibacterales bacterium]|jgi:hypothetical protein